MKEIHAMSERGANAVFISPQGLSQVQDIIPDISRRKSKPGRSQDTSNLKSVKRDHQISSNQTHDQLPWISHGLNFICAPLANNSMHSNSKSNSIGSPGFSKAMIINSSDNRQTNNRPKFFLDVDSLRKLFPKANAPRIQFKKRKRKLPPIPVEKLDNNSKEEPSVGATMHHNKMILKLNHTANRKKNLKIQHKHRRHKHDTQLDVERGNQQRNNRLSPLTNNPIHHIHQSVRLSDDWVTTKDRYEDQHQISLIATKIGISPEVYKFLNKEFNDTQNWRGIHCDSLIHNYEFNSPHNDESRVISIHELRRLINSLGISMREDELKRIIQKVPVNNNDEVDFVAFKSILNAHCKLEVIAQCISNSNHNIGELTIKKPHSTILTTSINSTNSAFGSSSMFTTSVNSLPPLKIKSRAKKAYPYDKQFSRPTPSCLRPGAQEDITELRRELALSEYGVGQLNEKLKVDLQWVRKYCPVETAHAQKYCKQWGLEKASQLILRMQSQNLYLAFHKWDLFLRHERNKNKASLFLKFKGIQRLSQIANRWERKQALKRLTAWKDCIEMQIHVEKTCASVVIQCLWRGKNVQKYLLRQLFEKSAVIIQSIVRGFLVHCRKIQIKRLEARHRSATSIQRVYRGYISKRIHQRLSKDQKELSSAIKIQKFYRVHKLWEMIQAQCQLKRQEYNAISVQRCYRSYLARKVEAAELHKRQTNEAALRIQSHFRGLLDRNMVKSIKSERKKSLAAVRIQTRYRIIMSIAAATKMKILRENKRQIKRKASECIQLHLKNFSIKQKYKREQLHKIKLREEQKQKRKESAVGIQRIYRGKRGRQAAKKMHLNRLEVLSSEARKFAAIKIQTCWRAYHRRLAFHIYKKSSMEQNIAATRIQSIRRRSMAQHKLSQLRSEKKERFAKIKTEYNSATNIQKVFRGRKSRHIVCNMRLKSEEEKLQALTQLRKDKEFTAAVVIQCLIRRYIVQRHVTLRWKDAEEKRMTLAKQLQRKQENAAILIQCVFRSYMARQLLNWRRSEFEKKLSLMDENNAFVEIKALREIQERELADLKKKVSVAQNIFTSNDDEYRKRMDDIITQDVAESTQSTTKRSLAVNSFEIVEKKHDVLTDADFSGENFQDKMILRKPYEEYQNRLECISELKTEREVEIFSAQETTDMLHLDSPMNEIPMQESFQIKKFSSTPQVYSAIHNERDHQVPNIIGDVHDELTVSGFSTIQGAINNHHNREIQHIGNDKPEVNLAEHSYVNLDMPISATEKKDQSAPVESITQKLPTSMVEGGKTIIPGFIQLHSDESSIEELPTLANQSNKLQLETRKLQVALENNKKDQARTKIQTFCIRRISVIRISKLEKQKAEAFESLENEFERMRQKAELEKELAIAKLKAMMDEEARQRDLELKLMEAKMIERAQKEKLRIVQRCEAAAKIQRQTHVYLRRRRMKAQKRKNEKEKKRKEAMMQLNEGTDDINNKATEKKVSSLHEERIMDAGVNANMSVNTEKDGEDNWIEYWDENAQASYYYNTKTQEASWTRPTNNKLSLLTTIDHDDDLLALPTVSENGTGPYMADDYGFYDQNGQYHYYNGRTPQKDVAIQAAELAARMMLIISGVQNNTNNSNGSSNYNHTAGAFSQNSNSYGSEVPNNAPGTGYNPYDESAAYSSDNYSGGLNSSSLNNGEWLLQYDTSTGAPYYINSITGESYWATPT